MRISHKTRGAALILTLVAIAIMAALCAGIGTLVIGHLSRATTDQNAAKALNYAEAALNFQIQRINTNLYGTPEALAASYGTPGNELVVASGNSDNPGPMIGYLPVVTRDDSCQAWVQPNLDLYNPNQDIFGRATISGAMRTVRAKGGPVGVFDQWAVFGVQNVTFNGNLTVTPPASSPTPGIVGSNGAVRMGGSSSVGGIALYGPNATSNRTPDRRFPQPIVLPTITDIANQAATYIRSYSGTPAPPYKSSVSTINGILNFATNNDNALARLPTNGNISSGNMPITLVGKPWGANYYLTNLDGSQIRITADTSQGPVNLWVNTFGDETLNGNDYIKADDGNAATPPIEDAKLFRVYYRNSSGTLEFKGNSTADAMFYAYDVFAGTPGGTIQMNGGAGISGSVIAYVVERSNGNAQIDWPSNPGVSPGEGILYYGIKTPWQEYNPVRGN